MEPNISIAQERLRSLGVEVVQVEKAPDNADQELHRAHARLPFPDASFSLVTNRHEAFVPSEVARILACGGRFLTQQVASGSNRDCYRLLGTQAPEAHGLAWNLDLAAGQVRRVGLVVEDGAEGVETMTFANVGALAWYLKNLPGVFPDFSADAFRTPLHRLHLLVERGEPLKVQLRIFWLKARKTSANP